MSPFTEPLDESSALKAQRLSREHHASMVREVHALGNALGPLISLTEVAAADVLTPVRVRDLLAQCRDLLATAAGSTSRLSGLIRRISPQSQGLSERVSVPRSVIPGSHLSTDSLPRLRLLCVEDDASVREMLVKLLHLLGQSANAVNSISSAMAAFSSEFYDAVITDLRLGEERGQDLTRRLRQERPVPVIWITGFDDGHDLSLLDPDVSPTFLLEKPLSLEGLKYALGIVADKLRKPNA